VLAYRVRRPFETKAFGLLRAGQVLGSEEVSLFKPQNLAALVSNNYLVIAEIPEAGAAPKKGKRK